MQNGTFLFSKGATKTYAYKNLSGGEKAAFDLILDFTLKREVFNDTVFAVDEPIDILKCVSVPVVVMQHDAAGGPLSKVR